MAPICRAKLETTAQSQSQDGTPASNKKNVQSSKIEKKDNVLGWTEIEQGKEMDRCPTSAFPTFRRCMLKSQLPDPINPERKYPDTTWITGPERDKTSAHEHFMTTSMEHYIAHKPCAKPLVSRSKLMWEFLLRKMTEKVYSELKRPPEIEPYDSTYMDHYNIPEFQGLTEEDDEDAYKVNEIQHPLYSESPETFWAEKYRKIRDDDLVVRTYSRNAMRPFRRNSVFTTPLDQRFNDPRAPDPPCSTCCEPSHNDRNRRIFTCCPFS